MGNQGFVWLWCIIMLYKLVLAKRTAPITAFTCNDGTNISLDKFCDGNSDCDGSDEIVANSMDSNMSASLFSCTRLRRTCLLHRRYICNGSILCDNVNPCDVGCPSHFSCLPTKRCVKRETICDGNWCSGCAEVDDWPNGVGFQCIRNSRLCRLPQQLLWDNVQDCDNDIDMCYKSNTTTRKSGKDIRLQPGVTFNDKNCFMCLDNTMIIPRHKVCDGTIDCSDLSDECLCARQPPEICNRVQLRNPGYSTRCRVGQVDCGSKIFSHCINRTAVCNGIVECRGNLDETFSFCKGTLPCELETAAQPKTTCRCSNFKRCESKTIANFCDGIEDCKLSSRESWFVPPGFPEDECGVGCPNVSSKFNCTVPGATAKGKPLQRYLCETSTQDANRTISFSRREITNNMLLFCDGLLDCLNRVDESSCPSRFTCNSKRLVSIPESRVCDGRIDCDDASDENKKICRHRYYCPALNGTLILDGKGDCLDWSDECSPKLVTENILSSKYELIANGFLRILVWIMAVLALVGNTVVIVGEIRTLKSMFRKSTSASLRANRMLVLNLATADFLMGVYLLMLGIAGAIYSGRYCSASMWWKTSQPCTAMGVLVVISSETSVLTLVLLTLLRGYSVYNPIDSLTKPGFRLTLVLIATTWGISLILAFVPLSSAHENIFVEEALIPNNPFFGSLIVHFKTAKNFTMKLLTYSSTLRAYPDNIMQKVSTINSWTQLQGFFSKFSDLSQYLNAQRFYSYYSSNSACVPKLFVTTNDKMWRFSLFTSILNFIAFLFIASVYTAIILKTRKTVSGSSSARDEHKTLSIQRKIMRLIITNFCCWVPLTIMVFVYFSGVKIDQVAYAISAIVLLPINSALNPLLYSNFLDKGWDAFRNKIKAAKSKHIASVGTQEADTRL